MISLASMCGVMDNLASFFEHMLDKKRQYLNASKGDEFENRIMTGMVKFKMREIYSDEVDDARSIKNVLRLRTTPIPNNTSHRNMFWKQPLGKQNYPDLLVFDENRLVCIEAKFSTKGQSKPVWNGGLPTQGGVYIFGSRLKEDLTFFLGRDVVSSQDENILRTFFDGLGDKADELNAKMTKQRYGFGVSIRRTYEQKKVNNPNAVLDYFKNPAREKLEKSVIEYCKKQG